MTNITIPTNMWDEDQEAALSTWYFKDGETVEAGTVVAEVMVEKSSFGILAPEAGLLKVLIVEEEIVTAGQVIGTLG